jgi:O-antigen/teichoic acid export membrane protein
MSMLSYKKNKVTIILARIFKSEDSKILLGNFTSLTLLQVFGYITPFITMPYLSRIIGVEKFGTLAFASSIIAYLQAIAVYGFNYTAVRDIAKNRKNLVYVSSVYSNVLVCSFLLMILDFLILISLICFVPLLQKNALVLLLVFLSVPGALFSFEWFFQAIERMKYITIMSTCSKLLFVILIFVVIKKRDDYIYIPVLTAIGYLLSGTISSYIIFKKLHVIFIFPSFHTIWTTLKNGWNMFVSIFLPNLYTNFSTMFLRIQGGEVATGLFDAGKRFISIGEQIIDVLSRTFFPFLARRLDKHSLYAKINLFICGFISISMFFGADLLIKIFFTKDFNDSARVIRILAISPFFLSLMNTYGTNYLVLVGKERVLRNIVLVCSIFGFLLSFLAITLYGFVGAAWTLTTVWGIRGGITYLYARKHKQEIEKQEMKAVRPRHIGGVL